MSTNKRTLRLYWEQMRLHKATLFISLLAIPCAALLIDTLLPYFLAQAVGGLTTHDQTYINQSLLWAGIVAGIGLGLNLLGFQMLLRHEANVRSGVANTTLKRLLEKDYTFFSNQKVGALTSRYIDFVRAHIHLQDIFVIRTLSFIVSVGAGLIIVALQAPLLSLLLLGLVAFLLIQVRVGLKIRKPYRHARKTMVGEINGHVADVLTNNFIVKTFATEKREEKTLAAENNKFRDIYVKDFTLMSIEGTLRLSTMVIAQIVAIAVAAGMVFAGELSLALAIFALTYLQRLASQLFTLGEMINGYDQAFLEAAPMTDILSKKTNVKDVQGAESLRVSTGELSLQKATFTHDDGEGDTLFRNFSLHIPAGQKVGLVGHSGSGKTTLTRLLLRFADLDSGSITIDGQDIAKVTQSSLREAISYVPQEPLLFHRTLRENVSYSKPNATDQEIRDAAQKAHALEFIDKLPDGLDTIVGERGVKLSGGQRQRIAIARAILKDAPILVLDEATSALDSESEKLIQASLGELMKGRTAIVIAHRLSTIQKMDRIVVLDEGKIIENGTHAELLKRKGTYAQLWAHQSGGFIED